MNNRIKFTHACVEALYFTDTSESVQPLRDVELAIETRLDLEFDCRSFWRRFGCYIEHVANENTGPANTIEQAGRDFWFTRNGHGAGFWGGGWPDPYADMLTKGAKCYGEFETYLGDDGKIHA